MRCWRLAEGVWCERRECSIFYRNVVFDDAIMCVYAPASARMSRALSNDPLKMVFALVRQTGGAAAARHKRVAAQMWSNGKRSILPNGMKIQRVRPGCDFVHMVHIQITHPAGPVRLSVRPLARWCACTLSHGRPSRSSEMRAPSARTCIHNRASITFLS